MAIFGELSDLPFRKLSSVLQPQTGTLVLHGVLGGRSAEVQVCLGDLHAVFIDGFPVRDAAQLCRAVQQLAASQAGDFEFVPAPVDELTHHWQLSLNDLLLDDPTGPFLSDEQLPHADTRFGLGRRPRRWRPAGVCCTPC